MDPGRAGAFFLGDSGSYDVPIFILLRLWKPELPCGGGIRGRGFVVETSQSKGQRTRGLKKKHGKEKKKQSV